MVIPKDMVATQTTFYGGGYCTSNAYIAITLNAEGATLNSVKLYVSTSTGIVPPVAEFYYDY